MDYSGKYDLEEAESLFRQNDPRCIELYVRNNSNTAKNRLSLIYLEGRCGQSKDVEKALSFTENNENYGARAIEAQIRIFEMGCSISEMQAYLLELIDIHEQMPTHTWVNRVLANMYLQGKAVPINFAKAVEINPKLLEQKVFNKAVFNIPNETRRKLFYHITSQRNDTWRVLVNESQREHVDSIYDKQIKSLISKKQWDEAADEAIKWFSEVKSVDSAYCVLKFALSRLSNGDYDRASDILETGPHTDRNIGCIIESARLREDWIRVEKWLSSESTDKPMYCYERGCLAEHRGNIKEACNYFIKSVYRNPKTGEYTNKSYDAICEVFTLEPDYIIWNSKYADLLLTRQDLRYRYVVAKALCECGDQRRKTQGKDLLCQIAEKYYFAATLLYDITGEQQYAGLAKRLEFNGKRLSDYFFDSNDSTDVIERRRQGLSPHNEIRALNELARRYLCGKNDTPVDYERAKMCLLEEIELCEEYHVITKYAQAKLGLMMAEGKIECTNEKTMFDSIYQLRTHPAYTCAVVKCLINGIGTERNTDEAIRLLLSANSPHILRELLRLSKKGEIDELEESMVLSILRQILSTATPHRDEIELLRSVSHDTVDQTMEIPYSRYQNTKKRALWKMGNLKKDEPDDAVRFWDFARRCGDSTSAIKEASFVLTKGYERLAYSILRTSDVDPQDPLYLRIGVENQILVNVDEELAKVIPSSKSTINL